MARSDQPGNERITLPSPNYEAVDVLVVREPEQLKALGDELRSKIVILLRDRAFSTTELAAELGLPKGTVGHHVKVLEKAGLVQVVRTRQVRAITEKLYGRTARLFLLKSTDTDSEDLGTTSAVVTSRLRDADARRLTRRLEKLTADFRAADDPAGEPYGLAAALYERDPHA